MDFDTLFAQVLPLLQREQRISYRVLKRRFTLSDEDLADLKDELIHAKKLAMDEENRVLFWIGDVAGTAETTSPLAQSIQQPPAQHHQPTQGVPRPTEPPTLEPEHCQLTLMFCDLVESIKLASQLDPEDLLVRQG
jgi:hypothetical protein